MNVIERQSKKSIQLQQLCQGIIPDIGNIAVEISGLCIDSRRCQAGDLFLAYPGMLVDGRDFIAQAIERGAAAVIYQQSDDLDRLPASHVPMIGAQNLQSLLGMLAYRFQGSLVSDMQITGITGTNGKTSIAYLIAQALKLLGKDCAYIGTLGVGCPPVIQPSALTTADAIENHAQLASFYQQGIHACAMEVSSHALDQGRVNGVPFKTAIFTNLSHDHLDYHQTMQAYGEAKARLLDSPGLESAIINIDDEWSKGLLSCVSEGTQVMTYSIEKSDADLYARTVQYSIEGIEADIVTPWGQAHLISPLLGHFNLSNLLATTAALALEAYTLEQIVKALSSVPGIPGRMECLRKTGAALAIVDYAHTPDALEQALKSINCYKQGKLYCVFGCGGDRDQDKRAIMGKTAEDWADHIIVTNDNPRSESPQAIIEGILDGVKDKSIVEVITDRKAAIEYCLQQATSSDVILVAGKGHEDYQLIGDDRLDFSDQAVIRDFWACCSTA